MGGQTFRPSDRVVATSLQGGAAVLLDLATTSHYDLNPTGALLWQQLAGGKTAAEAASALVAAFEVDELTARRDAEELVAELVECALLVPQSAQDSK